MDHRKDEADNETNLSVSSNSNNTDAMSTQTIVGTIDSQEINANSGNTVTINGTEYHGFGKITTIDGINYHPGTIFDYYTIAIERIVYDIVSSPLV